MLTRLYHIRQRLSTLYLVLKKKNPSVPLSLEDCVVLIEPQIAAWNRGLTDRFLVLNTEKECGNKKSDAYPSMFLIIKIKEK